MATDLDPLPARVLCPQGDDGLDGLAGSFTQVRLIEVEEHVLLDDEAVVDDLDRRLVGTAVVVVEAVEGLGDVRAGVVDIEDAVSVVVRIGTAVVVHEAVDVLFELGAGITRLHHQVLHRAIVEERDLETEDQDVSVVGLQHPIVDRVVVEHVLVAHDGRDAGGACLEAPTEAALDRPSHDAVGQTRSADEVDEGTHSTSRIVLSPEAKAQRRGERVEPAGRLVFPGGVRRWVVTAEDRRTELDAREEPG